MVLAEVPVVEKMQVLAVETKAEAPVVEAPKHVSAECAPKGEVKQMLKPGTIMPITQQKIEALTEEVKKNPQSWSYDKADAWLKEKFGGGMDYTRIGIVLRTAKGQQEQRPQQTTRSKVVATTTRDSALNAVLPAVVDAMKKTDAIEVTVRRNKKGEYVLSYDVEVIAIRHRKGSFKLSSR